MFRTALIMVLLTALPTFAQDGWIETIGYPLVLGEILDVERTDDLYFVCSKFGIKVFQFDDNHPEEPPEEQFIIPTPGLAQDVDIVDSLCYIADGHWGLGIYTFTLDGQVEEIGRYVDLWNASAVKVQDNVAYVIDYRSGMMSIDVEDPTNPEILGTFEQRTAEVGSMYFRDDLLFFHDGHGDYRIAVLDVENPAAMELVGFLDAGSMYNYILVDDYIYGVISSDSLLVIDAEDPSDMEVVNRLYLGRNYIEHILSVNSCLISYSMTVGFFSLRDPLHPELITNNLLSIGTQQAAVVSDAGTYMFGGNIFKINVVNIRDRNNPNLTHHLSIYDQAHDIAYSDGNVFIADDMGVGIRGQFRIFTVDDPYNARQIARLDSTSQYRDIVVIDTIAILSPKRSDEQNFMVTYNISDPESPVEINRFRLRYEAVEEMVAMGNLVFRTGVQDEHIVIFDFSNPYEPEPIFATSVEYVFDENSHMYGIDISREDSIVVTCGSFDVNHYGLATWRFKNNELSVLGTCNYNLDGGRVAVYEHHAYVVARWEYNRGMVVVDFSDPENPEVVYETDEIYGGTEIKQIDGLLYVCDGRAGIKIFDLENPAHPVKIAEVETPDYACGLDVNLEDGYMYVADRFDVGIYDISRVIGIWDLRLSTESHDFGKVPLASTASFTIAISNHADNPVEILEITSDSEFFTAHFPDSTVIEPDEEFEFPVTFTPTEAILYAGELTVRTDLRERKIALFGDGEYQGVDDDPEIPLEFALHSAYPNPFNSRMHLTYEVSQAGLLTLQIFDVNGRLVETLVNDQAEPGRYNATWNAVDIPSGVYLVRMDTVEGCFTQKVALMK